MRRATEIDPRRASHPQFQRRALKLRGWFWEILHDAIAVPLTNDSHLQHRLQALQGLTRVVQD